MNNRKTKCDYCVYFVGRECTAAKSLGKVNEYYCRDAQYEFNLNQKKSLNKSPLNTKYKNKR